MAKRHAALLAAILLVTAFGGCGGEGRGPLDTHAGPDAAAARIGAFAVQTVSNLPPVTVDFTPTAGSKFSYLGLAREEIKWLRWTSGSPPPAELAPILFVDFRPDSEIYAVMLTGEGQRQLTDNDAGDGHPGWSPDGTAIVFNSARTGNNDVWIMNAAGGNARNLTKHPARDSAARWRPTGEWLAFKSDRTGHFDIYSMRTDGSRLRRLTADPAFERAAEWFPDGLRLLFSSNRDGDQDIYRMTRFGKRVTQLIDSPDADFRATVSPDGSRVAFHSLRDGDMEIYVMNADGSGQVNITNDPARDAHPEWAPDGTRIVFNSDRTGTRQAWTMRPDGSDLRQLTHDPTSDVECVAWYVPGSKRVLVGRPTADGGYDPPLGAHAAAVAAAYDANSLRSAVGISGAGGARVFIWKPAREGRSPRLRVRSPRALMIVEDRGRLLQPITHLRYEDDVRECLIRFARSTGRVAAVRRI